MSFIIFAVSYPFILLLSKLPMRVLYLKSNFLYYFLYYIVGYRKKVVLENLKLSFPKKTDKELKEISKKFFKHLTDLIVESIKVFSISEKEILKRYKYVNPELVNGYIKAGKSIALTSAHQANWELSISLPLVLDAPLAGAYSILQNKYFDKVVKKSRGKFGGICVKASEIISRVEKNFLQNKQRIYILLSDQSPRLNKKRYWRNFFGVKVPFHTGMEMLSKKFDLVVINYVARKIKRGYYEVEFQLITDSPKEFKDYKITDKYVALTEENILKQPALYLWSHKRFKHKDKVPN